MLPNGIRLLAIVLVAVAIVGCASRPFQVTGFGTGATQKEAGKSAWYDAAEKVRQQGHRNFRLVPAGAPTPTRHGDTYELTATYNAYPEDD
jgi:hypothetical protein